MIRDSNPDLYLFSSDYPHIEGGRDPLGRFTTSLRGFDDAVNEKFYAGNMRRLLAPPHLITAAELVARRGHTGRLLGGQPLRRAGAGERPPVAGHVRLVGVAALGGDRRQRGRSGRTNSRFERSKRSTRAISFGPTPYSAANCSVRWRRLQPSSAASAATSRRPSVAARRRHASVVSARAPTAPRPGRQRAQQDAVEHGEALVPRRGHGEPVEQLAGGAAPQGIERDDVAGELAGRQPEQRPRAGRGHVELDAVLVAVVADHRRRRVEAAQRWRRSAAATPAVRAARRARAARRSGR